VTKNIIGGDCGASADSRHADAGFVTLPRSDRALENHTEPPTMTQGAAAAPQASPLCRFVLKHWPRLREKVVYLAVGALNTAFAYGCFSLLYYLLHKHQAAWVILSISYVIQSVFGFLSFRYLVFGPARHPVIEYLRYQAVYLPLLVMNCVVLPLALKHSDLNAYAIQALLSVFAIIAGYVGSKYFTFRKSRTIGCTYGKIRAKPSTPCFMRHEVSRQEACFDSESYCERGAIMTALPKATGGKPMSPRALKVSRAQLASLDGCDDIAVPSYLHWNPLIRWLMWRRCDEILRLGQFRQDHVVLDFGCGAGVLLPSLCACSKSVVGCDVIPQYAQSLVEALGLDAEVVDSMDSLENSRFDRIIAADVLEHVPDPREQLERFAQLLKPDGRVLVSGPTESRVYRLGRLAAGFGDKGDYHKRNISDICRLAEESGYRVLGVAALPFPIPPYLFRVYAFGVDRTTAA
jgi:SAM-dependent methyltransferase/putative flippase GtrA